MPGPFVIIRDPRGSLVHVRKADGESGVYRPWASRGCCQPLGKVRTSRPPTKAICASWFMMRALPDTYITRRAIEVNEYRGDRRRVINPTDRSAQ